MFHTADGFFDCHSTGYGVNTANPVAETAFKSLKLRCPKMPKTHKVAQLMPFKTKTRRQRRRGNETEN